MATDPTPDFWGPPKMPVPDFTDLLVAAHFFLTADASRLITGAIMGTTLHAMIDAADHSPDKKAMTQIRERAGTLTIAAIMYYDPTAYADPRNN